MRLEKALCGEDVRVGSVADVGEVPEVVVGADLPARAAGGVGFDNRGYKLDVALAEHEGRTEGGGEEGGGGSASVGGEDEGFGGGLGWEDVSMS